MDLFVDLFRQNLFEQMGASLLAFSLLLVRILAFIHFAPVFSHKSVPAHTKIALSLLLTFMLSPRVLSEPLPEDGYSLSYTVIVNFCLGFVMGFTASLLFHTLVSGGEMMDASMGFSSAQIFEPGLGQQTTILGRFMNEVGIVVFFFIGGPEMLLAGLSKSLDNFSIYDPTLEINLTKIISMCGDIINMGFLLVCPIIITILINDIVLGLISRAAPQINAFQISFTIKPTVGLITWLLIMPLFFKAIIGFLSRVSNLF